MRAKSESRGLWEVFRPATVGRRLGFAFATLLLLSAFMAILGSWRLSTVSAATERIVGIDMNTERVVRDWYSETRANAVRALVLTHSDDPELSRLLSPELDAASKRISELQKRVEESLKGDEPRELFAKVGDQRKLYLAARSAAIDLKKSGKKEEANRLVDGRLIPAIASYVASIQKLVDYYVRDTEQSAKSASATANAAILLLAATALLSLCLGFVIAWRTTAAITRPLVQAAAVADNVARGDLTSDIEVRGSDEMGRLLQSLKDMNESLAQIVGEVRATAEAIGSGTRQIASGNADLSKRTEEQASSLEETTSSMEELTSTVQQNADNARQANQLAIGASNVAVRGGAVVSQVVGTMNSINESSKKIVDIIGVIDGIAFQTNILALNAAVEAARAGEQGRGFAVVATEVRNLAQRSAAAAKEIKALIGDSVDKVQAGTRLVDAAGSTMEEIVTAVKRVTDIMGEITEASQEQSAGIEQVNRAISRMDETTAQNAALVEQAAAAAEALDNHSARLERSVAMFKLSRMKEAGEPVWRQAGTPPSSVPASTTLTLIRAEREKRAALGGASS